MQLLKLQIKRLEPEKKKGTSLVMLKYLKEDDVLFKEESDNLL